MKRFGHRKEPKERKNIETKIKDAKELIELINNNRRQIEVLHLDIKNTQFFSE